MKWYHEWKQNAIEKFLAGHYPGHERVPNAIVRCLYGVGYFLGDFVPLILNFIDGIYTAIKRLLAFIVGLLIEASTVIVLIGTIAFSVVHSIELLRRAGATGGLEYVGVLMFEVVFVASTAMMTGMFMSGQKPKQIFKNAGFWFCVAGFMVGTLFVLWSNISAMAPSWEGKIIGIMTPVLLIIAEGLLAYRTIDVVKGTAQQNGELEKTLKNEFGELEDFRLEKMETGEREASQTESSQNESSQAGEWEVSQEKSSQKEMEEQVGESESSQKKSSQEDLGEEQEEKLSQVGEAESSQNESSQAGEWEISREKSSQNELGEQVSQEDTSSQLETSLIEKEEENRGSLDQENAVKSMVEEAFEQQKEEETPQTYSAKKDLLMEPESSQNEFSQAVEWEVSQEKSSQKEMEERVGDLKSSQKKSSQEDLGEEQEEKLSQVGEAESSQTESSQAVEWEVSQEKSSQKEMEEQVGESESSQKKFSQEDLGEEQEEKLSQVGEAESSQNESSQDEKSDSSQTGGIKVEELPPQEQYKLALKKAREILEQEGSLPPRRRLMEEYGGKEWPARRALDQLDFEIALKKAEEFLKKGKLPTVKELQELSSCKKKSAEKALKKLEKKVMVTA